jgi:hypothetical protein
LRGLVSRGWRVLTRVKGGVRRRVALAQLTVAGLSVGHPLWATAHPPPARLLEACPGLPLTIIRAGRRRRRHLMPRARAATPARPPRWPGGHLSEALSRLSQTARNMSEPGAITCVPFVVGLASKASMADHATVLVSRAAVGIVVLHSIATPLFF